MLAVSPPEQEDAMKRRMVDEGVDGTFGS